MKACKSFFNVVGNFSNKNVNVTTITFLMSGDLTGLCLYIIPKGIPIQNGKKSAY